MRRADRGYASVAAVAALAVLGAVAYLISTSDRAAITALETQARRAKLEAAADAGLDFAVRGLSASSPEQRWSVQGAERRVQFQGFDLRISIQDEHGKISLSDLTEPSAVRLFEDLGRSEDAATDVAESLLDWVDADHDPRPHGAEDAAYAGLGLKPRNQAPLTLDELIRVRGMDRQLLARLEPLVTAQYDATGGFDGTTASAEVQAVMAAAGDQSPQAIQARVNRLTGQPTVQPGPSASLIGRRLTVDVHVRDAEGAAFERLCLIELTGASDRPYVVRSCSESRD